MRGKPKYLNTKEDYMNFLNMTEEDGVTKEDKEKELNDLLSDIEDWYFEKYLDKAEDGIEDETHMIISNENSMGDESNTPKFSQYVFKKNEGAKIFRLGFTVQEVNDLLSNL